MVTSAIAVAFVAFAVDVRCNASAPVPPRSPVAATAPPWFWYAPRIAGPWRLPGPVVGLVQANDSIAIAITATSLLPITIANGEVGDPIEVMPKGSWMGSLIRIGDRVVAFGEIDDRPAAWEIGGAPLTVRAIALDDPEPVAARGVQNAVSAVSPDGARVVICGDLRWPTVRDARTLVTERVLRGIECPDVHFAGETQVVFDDRIRVELSTGRRTTLDDAAPREVGGPHGRVFEATGTRYAIRDGASIVRARDEGAWATAVWTPDGTRVISIASTTVTIRDIRDPDADRVIPLPSWASPHIAVSDRTLLLVQGTAGIAIDLASGIVRRAAGELAPILGLAPRAGAIVTVSDRVRVRRGASVLAETAGDQMVAPSRHAPITVLDGRSLDRWDPDTGERRRIATLDRVASVLAHAPDRLVVATSAVVQRVDGTNPPQPWVELAETASLQGVDPTGARLVASVPGSQHVIDPATRTATSLATLGACDDGLARVGFSPDGTRIAIESLGRVVVVELATRVRVADVPLPRSSSWAMTSRDELVVASPYELELWDLAAGASRAWLSPAGDRPTQVVVGEAELAVGYAADQLLWVDLAGLRMHAKPSRALPRLPAQQCWNAPGPSYDRLVRAP